MSVARRQLRVSPDPSVAHAARRPAAAAAAAAQSFAQLWFVYHESLHALLYAESPVGTAKCKGAPRIISPTGGADRRITGMIKLDANCLVERAQKERGSKEVPFRISTSKVHPPARQPTRAPSRPACPRAARPPLTWRHGVLRQATYVLCGASLEESSRCAGRLARSRPPAGGQRRR
jgi:hypothetical protein